MFPSQFFVADLHVIYNCTILSIKVLISSNFVLTARNIHAQNRFQTDFARSNLKVASPTTVPPIHFGFGLST